MELTVHLSEWLKTFELGENRYTDVKQLCDGVAIATALVQIAPEYFTSTFLAKIETKCNNWYLRASNLRKIYASLMDYYSEVVEKNIPDSIQPDMDAIAKDYDMVQLGKLLQLILGCAINCENKTKHIEVMTTLSLEVKQSLKTAIDEIENIDQNNAAGESTPSLVNNEEFEKLREQLVKECLEKEKTIEKCIEMENLISKLKEEKQNLKAENDKLVVKLETGSKTINSESNLRFDSIEHEALFQRFNNQINQYQCDISKIEEQKEDYKINLEIKEKEYHKLLMQNEQLQSKLSEYKRDRDELDRLKYLNEEFIKYKNITEVQKKKLEEFQELKKQIKLLEERNTTLVKQICELEEDKKSVAVYRAHLELIKKQRDELRSKMNEESFRADKAEDELKRLYNKFNEIKQDNEKKHSELESLKSEVASLQKGDVLNVTSIDLDFSGMSNATNAAPASKTSSELNEKLTRLEFENKRLKESNDEKMVLLQAQLDEERQRAMRLETENRANSQKIIELQGHLNEVMPINNDQSNRAEDTGLRAKLQELQELQNENSNLKTQLESANHQLAEHDERFKKHVHKAKETVDVLLTHVSNSKASNSLPDTSRSSEDVDYWKNLVNLKDSEIEKLKQDYENKLEFREIEENLMAVNFHNLSFNLHRKGTEERMSHNYNSHSTFLARQRQASAKKFVINPSGLGE